MKSFLNNYLINDISNIVCDYMTDIKNFDKYECCIRELDKMFYSFKLYCITTLDNRDRICFFKWYARDASRIGLYP